MHPFLSHFQLPQQTLVVSDMPLESALPRCALRGSLDPTTGIFYRAPERARIRTAQACDKCRTRKAKCSGDHPMCERCRIRGLVCHYDPERRARRWSRATAGTEEAVLDRSGSLSDASLPRVVDERTKIPARASSVEHRSASSSSSTIHSDASEPPKTPSDAPTPEDDVLYFDRNPPAFLDAIFDHRTSGGDHPLLPRAALCFDTSPADPYERSLLPCMDDSGSPYPRDPRTPSTSPSASPVTRTSSDADGLPPTPTSSPFSHALHSPHLGPRPYALFASEMPSLEWQMQMQMNMDMDMDVGLGSEHVAWHDVKDGGARAFASVYMDMDDVF